MNNRFKIRKILRFTVNIIAIIFCGNIILTICRFILDDSDIISIQTFIIMLVCSIAIAHCAISFHKTEYEVKDETLIISEFLKRGKIYLFSEISKIEEAEAGPFTYIKLFLKDNKKHNIPPLDNQKKFINIINAKLRKA